MRLWFWLILYVIVLSFNIYEIISSNLDAVDKFFVSWWVFVGLTAVLNAAIND